MSLNITVLVTLGGGKVFGITDTNEMVIEDQNDADGTFILLGDATLKNLRALQSNISRLEIHATPDVAELSGR